MATELAKYACDECRNRKTRCSREAAGCTPCIADGRKCVYSRSGIIRRRARRPKTTSYSSLTPQGNSTASDSRGHTPPVGDLESQMTYDITKTHDSLRKYGDGGQFPTNSLDFLGAEYSSFWQGPTIQDMARELAMTEKKFLPFDEEQSSLFAAINDRVMENGRPIFVGAPPEISRMAFANPERIAEKAHLLMIYGTVLTVAALDGSYDSKTVMKLRWNLRLSLDDANLLLEPTQLNVQALVMLAIHFQEICTPSLTWMAVSTASRMLQFLGVNNRSLDQDTRDHRIALFWGLNSLDKVLAVVFGKAPSLPASAARNIPPVSMQQLLQFQPTHSTPGVEKKTQSMFGAHYMDHFFRSSNILADVWHCIFEDSSTIERATKHLDDWFQRSISTLTACLTSERAFLDPVNVESMQLGIDTVHFHYNYLHVLLIRSRADKRTEAVAVSQKALFVLDRLVADSTEFYNGTIWINLYTPFTPFFVLFGDVLSLRTHTSAQRSLAAMQTMSSFLSRMKPHHPQAAKLATVAATFVGYAETLVQSSTGTDALQHDLENTNLQQHPVIDSPCIPSTNEQLPTDWQNMQQAPAQQPHTQPLADVFNDPSVQDLSMDLDFWFPTNPRVDGSAPHPDSMDGVWNGGNIGGDAYGFFSDINFDWLSWDPDPSLSVT